MKRRYSNNKIIVLWDSDKCIHSGMCDGQLPEVFDPSKRPWVNLRGADVETIKRVIDDCPSGALSYKTPNQKISGPVTIKVIENGPYKVTGRCKLVNSEGEVLDAGNVFALCRCAASKRMPFCDGSHYHQKPARVT
jgi:uncharacterized Fe-S cluster protein YjdI